MGLFYIDWAVRMTFHVGYYRTTYANQDGNLTVGIVRRITYNGSTEGTNLNNVAVGAQLCFSMTIFRFRLPFRGNDVQTIASDGGRANGIR